MKHVSELSLDLPDYVLEDLQHDIEEVRFILCSYINFNLKNLTMCKLLTKQELAQHCRRRTRGEDETTELIEELFLSMANATDTLGVPLMSSGKTSIWDKQKKHVKCIQDVPGRSLYMLIGHVTQMGIQLRVYGCARGSTSLESFHLQLARFIPGSSANAVNFQSNLLDGIMRWNAARSVN